MQLQKPSVENQGVDSADSQHTESTRGDFHTGGDSEVEFHTGADSQMGAKSRASVESYAGADSEVGAKSSVDSQASLDSVILVSKKRDSKNRAESRIESHIESRAESYAPTSQKTFSLAHWRAISRGQILIFFALLAGALVLDQYVKQLMLGGFAWDSEALTIGGRALVYNRGVAFSMLSFLEESLKYLQIFFLIALVAGSMLSDFFARHFVPLGVLVGSGFSNILDRFIHGGVVDYVYWHYYFDFAIFNLADVLIDVSVALMVLQMLRTKRDSTKSDDSKPVLKSVKTRHCCG